MIGTVRPNPSRGLPGCNDDCPSGEFWPYALRVGEEALCNGDGHYLCPQCGYYAGPAEDPYPWIMVVPLAVAYPYLVQERLGI